MFSHGASPRFLSRRGDICAPDLTERHFHEIDELVRTLTSGCGSSPWGTRSSSPGRRLCGCFSRPQALSLFLQELFQTGCFCLALTWASCARLGGSAHGQHELRNLVEFA